MSFCTPPENRQDDWEIVEGSRMYCKQPIRKMRVISKFEGLMR
jgi:hypothetical protein